MIFRFFAKRWRFFSILIFCPLFFSCASNQKFQAVTSISQLEGVWESNGRQIEYPLKSGKNRFFRISLESKDINEEFAEKARKMGFGEGWEWARRHAINDDFPRADSNGTQSGSRLFLDENGRVQSQKTFLAVEIVAMQNLNVFSISEDGRFLITNGDFKLYSDDFDDVKAEKIDGVWEKK